MFRCSYGCSTARWSHARPHAHTRAASVRPGKPCQRTTAQRGPSAPTAWMDAREARRDTVSAVSGARCCTRPTRPRSTASTYTLPVRATAAHAGARRTCDVQPACNVPRAHHVRHAAPACNIMHQLVRHAACSRAVLSIRPPSTAPPDSAARPAGVGTLSTPSLARTQRAFPVGAERLGRGGVRHIDFGRYKTVLCTSFMDDGKCSYGALSCAARLARIGASLA